MIKLLAADFIEGWAFIEEGGKFFSMRRPYHLSDKMPVLKLVIDDAVLRYGFTAATETFATWAELVNYLKERFIQMRRAAGSFAPSEVQAQKLIRAAPPLVVEQFLSRIENELIPNAAWNAAELLIGDILQNPSVQCSQLLVQRCAKLLEQCRRSERLDEKRHDDFIGTVVVTNDIFAAAIRKVGKEKLVEITHAVKKHDLWLLCA